MEGPLWAAGLQDTLLTREAAHTMDDSKGDANAGLAGRHVSSGKPERLRGWVMMGLLIREVTISLSLHQLSHSNSVMQRDTALSGAGRLSSESMLLDSDKLRISAALTLRSGPMMLLPSA